MPYYSDAEIVETRRRSSSRRPQVHQVIPRDSDDSFEEMYARRRPSSRPTNNYPPRAASVDYVEIQERGRRPSRIVVEERRYNSLSGESRARAWDAESDLVSPRTKPQQLARRKSSRRLSRQLTLAPCAGETCHENGHKVGPDTPSLDVDIRSAADIEAAHKKLRNKELLAAGLASITTVAAANNIYQSSKASKERRESVRNGSLCEEGAKSMKHKAMWMDLFSVGVAAVCVTNAVNGWKNMDKQREQTAKFEARKDSLKSIVSDGPGLYGSRMGSIDWNGRHEGRHERRHESVEVR